MSEKDHEHKSDKGLTDEQLNNLKAKGYSCTSCWWQEGGRCYLEPCERREDGRSKKMADELCIHYTNKRRFLERLIPRKYLTIASEENGKK